MLLFPLTRAALRRSFSLPRAAVSLRTLSSASDKPSIGVTFVLPSGERVAVRAALGDSMLEVAHANKIDVEGASLAGLRALQMALSGSAQCDVHELAEWSCAWCREELLLSLGGGAEQL